MTDRRNRKCSKAKAEEVALQGSLLEFEPWNLLQKVRLNNRISVVPALLQTDGRRRWKTLPETHGSANPEHTAQQQK